MTAAQAISAALSNIGYRCHLECPFDRLDGQTFNLAVRTDSTAMLRLMLSLQPIADMALTDLIIPSVKRLVRRLKPVLVISVYPVGNQQLLSLAKSVSIPLLLIPTDLGFSHFLRMNDYPSHGMHIGIPFDSEVFRSQASKAVPTDRIHVIGFPVRPSFQGSQPSGRHAPHRFRVLLMMGGQGCNGGLIPEIASKICDSPIHYTKPVRLYVLLGKNTQLIDRLQWRTFRPYNKNVSVRTFGYADEHRMASLMHKSDLLITKPGGSTVNEAMAVGLPALYVSESPQGDLSPMPWELENMNYPIREGFACKADLDTLDQQVSAAMASRRSGLDEKACPSRNFSSNLQGLVRRLTSSNHGYTGPAGILAKTRPQSLSQRPGSED